MSFPVVGGVSIKIELSAQAAASLAHYINYVLSRVQDVQKVEDAWSEDSANRRSAFDKWGDEKLSRDARMALMLLNSVRVCEGVNIVIIPDSPSPVSSGYSNYSGPSEGQYIPK